MPTTISWYSSPEGVLTRGMSASLERQASSQSLAGSSSKAKAGRGGAAVAVAVAVRRASCMNASRLEGGRGRVDEDGGGVDVEGGEEEAWQVGEGWVMGRRAPPEE